MEGTFCSKWEIELYELQFEFYQGKNTGISTKNLGLVDPLRCVWLKICHKMKKLKLV